MTDLTMYDSAYNDQFPARGQAYAGYVDGGVGDQPNYGYIVKTYPQAHHLSIALDPAHDADMLDIENGAASPQDAAGWYERQVKRGAGRPGFYASAFTMEADLIPVITAARFARAKIRLWSAHYGAGRHICGPASCGLVSVAMDGTQWTDNALGRNLDESDLVAGFFGPVTPPKDWTYGPPLALSATGGHESVRLTWQPPAGAPEPPAAYQVFIYQGTLCDRATQVASYPRTVTTMEFEGGSLVQGRTYTAHVVAEGPGGTRVRKYTYASATFKTG